MPRATRSSWKILPVPEARAALGLSATFTRAETDVLIAGHVPEAMEDKWFAFFEDGWLYLHRSWTGACIYWLRLDESPAGSSIAESWVSRDSEYYRETDTDWDRRLLAFLLDAVLLRKPVPIPQR